MSAKTLTELLDETPVLSILPPKRTLVTLSSEQTIAECLDVLTQNKLSCAPVRAADGALRGFLDVLDLTRHVVDVASRGQRDLADDKLDDVLERANSFLHQPLAALLATRACQPYHAVSCAASTRSAAALMLAHDTQRLGVERGGVPLSTVKLADVIALAARGHADIARPDQPLAFPPGLLSRSLGAACAAGHFAFADVGTRRAADGGSAAAGVITVHERERLLTCFEGAALDGSVGVVDDDGKLIGNLSAWDLKWINRHSLISLTLPISSYLKHVREAMMAPLDYLVTVTLKSSIGSLLKKFAENHVHRIYVIDGDGKPVGFVKNSELLKLLQSEA